MEFAQEEEARMSVRKCHIEYRNQVLDEDMIQLKAKCRNQERAIADLEDRLRASESSMLFMQQHEDALVQQLRKQVEEIEEQEVIIRSLQEEVKELHKNEKAEILFEKLKNELHETSVRVQSQVQGAMEIQKRVDTEDTRRGLYMELKKHVKQLEGKYLKQQDQVKALWGRVRELVLCCRDALGEANKYRRRCSAFAKMLQQAAEAGGAPMSQSQQHHVRAMLHQHETDKGEGLNELEGKLEQHTVFSNNTQQLKDYANKANNAVGEVQMRGIKNPDSAGF